ncbi:hypothetical protein [Salinicola halophilus]|uniref:hypothetical protein n=1 Tax=Salinicola halophilus TaxID=184065 RepID=UPI000DA1C06A|nr:hypothetical protein [Salinicola halophilus]
MARNGTYYLGRVIKTGALETEHIKSALRSSESFTTYGSSWTFLDVEELSDGSATYFFGRLVKYDPDAEVTVVDPEARREVRQREPNMTIASSPFVYIPDHQGLAFLHVAGQISYETFMSRWSSVVNASHFQILSNCSVEAVSDIESFTKKVKALDNIYFISSTVSPPNPMFGPLWENLKNYLVSRKTDRMKIEEDGAPAQPINTELAQHMERMLVDEEASSPLSETLPIGDAAILMAVDGYGKGVIRGKRGDKIVTIKTSETTMNFTFPRDPDPFGLYKKAAGVFEEIKSQRHMRHS